MFLFWGGGEKRGVDKLYGKRLVITLHAFLF